MSRSQQKPSSKRGPAATKDPEDPEVPLPRPSADDESESTLSNGTVVVSSEPACDKRDDQEQVDANGAASKRERKAKNDKPRATAMVDVSKEAAADTKVTGFWSFVGVMFGRMTRYMGSADSRQRRAGYSLVMLILVTAVVAFAIVVTAYTVISVYGNKAVAFGVGGTILTTGSFGAYLKHRREKGDKG